MAWITNGNKDSPPELSEDVLQIVVVGERRCGKTSFIRAFYDHHYPRDMYSDNVVRVYPCEYWWRNRTHKLAILEIPSDPDFVEQQRTPHYENADAIIFMHAIDDPVSYQMLYEKWIPEVGDIVNSIGILTLAVGTKKDLRGNQQVTLDLLVQNFLGYMECSTNNLEEVNDIFNAIFRAFTGE